METTELDFCLLIPCFNDVDRLIHSLRSVFYDAQRFTVVVVDDGSAMPLSVERLRAELKNIASITVLRNQENKGIAESLNNGLAWIENHLRVKYIARLDCGDVCSANRFYRQVNYLDTNPEIGLLGAWCFFQNKSGTYHYQYRTPTEHRKIKQQMHWRNVFIHPTVMFRTDVLERSGHYPTNFLHAEDYAFFWNLLKIAPSHILGEFLVTCEIRDDGLSFKNRSQQLLMQIKIIDQHGTNRFMKIIGIFRLKTLYILPKRVLLPLKQILKRQ